MWHVSVWSSPRVAVAAPAGERVVWPSLSGGIKPGMCEVPGGVASGCSSTPSGTREAHMRMSRLIPSRSLNIGYYRRHGVRAEDISQAVWQKSTFSSYNGSCFEIARLVSDRVGVRDTKDNGSGPVLIFNQNEWSAFLAGVRAGEFDSI